MYEFKKIKNNHNRLRDDITICHTCSPIVVGESVILFAEPRDSGSMRMINTSPVTKIEHINMHTVRVNTESGSVYEITDMKD